MRKSYQALAQLVRAAQQDNCVWMPMPPFRSIGCNASVYLALLIDWQVKKHPDCEKQEDGWFPCSIQELKLSLKLTPGRQTRLLQRLEQKGFIRRKRSGTPPIRYLWIDYDHFYKEHQIAVEEYEELEKSYLGEA